MPYELSWEPQGVVKRHHGDVTGLELLRAVEETENNQRFDSYRYVINDFLDCTSISCTQQDINSIAAIDYGASISNKNIKVAIVATNPEIKAIGNAYANDPLTPFPTMVFDTISDARKWIGEVAKG